MNLTQRIALGLAKPPPPIPQTGVAPTVTPAQPVEPQRPHEEPIPVHQGPLADMCRLREPTMQMPAPIERDPAIHARVPVTIIVTTYKDHAVCCRALESAIAQDCSQIILIDDCSDTLPPPQLWELIAKNGILFIRHDKNRGLAAARNTAIALATNDWIIPLDADDTFHHKAVERLYAFLEDADVICGNITINGQLNYAPGLQHADKDTHLCKFTRQDWREQNLLFCSSLIRKQIWQTVGGYPVDEHIEQFEDYRFWCRCYNRGTRFKVVPVLAYEHTASPRGMCKRLEPRGDFFRTLATKGLDE